MGFDYYNVDRNLKYIAPIFCIRSKNKYRKVATTSPLPLTFDSLPYHYPGRIVIIVIVLFGTKMTGKDDHTISCPHLMVKLSVLADRKIILKGGW